MELILTWIVVYWLARAAWAVAKPIINNLDI